MRDTEAAHSANVPAPQAPARNASPPRPPPSPASFDTYDSHRKIRRPKVGDGRVYRPARRLALSRIDETPQARPRTRSLQRSADFSSTRPMLRSRSNISADTSRSVPVCNQSHEVGNQLECPSPRDAEPGRTSRRDSDSASSYGARPESMTDLPVVVAVDAVAGAYVPYADYAYHPDDGRGLTRLEKKKLKKLASKSNLYLAFMY